MKVLPIHLDSGRRSPRKHGIPASRKHSRSGSIGVPCPYCQHPLSLVVDSRPTAAGTTRRVRVCVRCERRYTTFEMHRPDFIPDYQI